MPLIDKMSTLQLLKQKFAKVDTRKGPYKVKGMDDFQKNSKPEGGAIIRKLRVSKIVLVRNIRMESGVNEYRYNIKLLLELFLEYNTY